MDLFKQFYRGVFSSEPKQTNTTPISLSTSTQEFENKTTNFEEVETTTIEFKNQLAFKIVSEKNQRLLYDSYETFDIHKIYQRFSCNKQNCYYVFANLDSQKLVYFVNHSNNEDFFGDVIGWTALQWAAAIGDEEIVQFLLRNGAIDDVKDSTGRNAQEIAHFLLNELKIVNNYSQKRLVEITPKINDIHFQFYDI